jgi:hypothetical protein
MRVLAFLMYVNDKCWYKMADKICGFERKKKDRRRKTEIERKISVRRKGKRNRYLKIKDDGISGE